MKQKIAFGCIVLLLILSSCRNVSSEEQTLYVAAASDLYHALTEIGEHFTNETNITLEFTFGSTGQLTQQIQEGAPFDLFLAAHESYIDRLIDEEMVFESSKQYYAIGRLVMMHAGNEEMNLGKEFLASELVKTITIAHPEHAPYGKAAKETLESWGVWEAIDTKVVYAENIRQAYQYVESGNADVGMVALALMTETESHYQLVDKDLHQPLLQALGIPVQTKNKELSQQFTDFILSEQGQLILKKYGFDLP
ncbi:molybdate ABC transporter substrate-binding protein [Bacillus solitudinis]|uniref:molybdate ABC transporter substrate-binding protein n=1 Tax=Bacillus solitudinis TaxID=2014074 RepID=UPI000C2485E8|nr:molybdate ABC transporter substrate-binding protein [Bacillus solitudinis]